MSLSNYPNQEGLYDPQNEHDACGIGCITNIKGKKSHDIVQKGIQILVNLTHRGATGYDPKTGDGAGILTQLPHEFFAKALKGKINLPEATKYGVGMTFIPKDPQTHGKIKETIESITKLEGQWFLGWRDVPVNSKCLGDLARSSEPNILQFFIGSNEKNEKLFERKLYVIRRQIEKEMDNLGQEYSQVYIPSLSARTIVYKGLLLADQISQYYLDLNDTSFTSSIALVHQRFSTNTFPSWPLAQPFRFIAHNGEINTLKGNVNAMKARYKSLSSKAFSKDISKIIPFIDETGSDSSCFDNTVEFLALDDRSLPHAMMMMIPEAWGELYPMGVDRRGFYEYNSMIMEPWDGPAAMVFTDGTQVGATLDRNGLRPGRYYITDDDNIVIASETGVLPYTDDHIIEKGRLQPGKMLLINTQTQRVIHDHEAKAAVYRGKPYRRWVEANKISIRGFDFLQEQKPINKDTLLSLQLSCNYNHEVIENTILPMAIEAHEKLGSMGYDSPVAVLSHKEKVLFDYFKQSFAQVTNPPIDPIREKLVMSLRTHIGRNHNILEEGGDCAKMFSLPSPIMGNDDLRKIVADDHSGLKSVTLSTLFDADDSDKNLEKAITKLCKKAEEYSKEDYAIIVLSDRGKSENKAAIPSLLAISSVHHHLIREGLRTQTSILVECADAYETMHMALLIGYGASAVNPYLVFDTITMLHQEGRIPANISLIKSYENFITSINDGLRKILSKMGISTIRSYRGAQIFECLGLDKEVAKKYFNNTVCRIGGIPMKVIQEETLRIHRKGYSSDKTQPLQLEDGGEFALRKKGEKHLWTAKSIHSLQQAVRNNDKGKFKEYAALINDQNTDHYTIRGLLDFKESKAVPIDEVEPADEIMKRFCTGAMSFGSISREAHETLAVAMNMIGGKSNTGEGGEDPERFKTRPDGTSACSAIKQIASGRFGVTAEYLANARELQIKIAQGAKPGEGGQLPGHKVTQEIAKTRNSTPGVSLISPPPHHDIYSIEDLAQLIFDLKNANPTADVSVKLVSESGVGTIAAGVAKSKAHQVTIAGYDGGTGASPISSIKHAGVPWELGLSETQQVLVKNNLRGRIRVQTDGQLKTGRDVAIACLLGAEEFGFATAPLVSVGCIMMRKCHNNTCPVGVATQDPELRGKFTGKPEHVVNFFKFIAEELRENMAALGFKTIDEMVGRCDMLKQKENITHWKAKHVNLSDILYQQDKTGKKPLRNIERQEDVLGTCLDNKLIELSKKAIDKKQPVEFKIDIANTDRTAGTMLSGTIAKKYGREALPEDTIKINLNGTAGQSFGAFLSKGITMILTGEGNDYVGKGLSGGKIAIKPQENVSFDPSENVIIGNTTLYGATSGKLFVNGTAGERFAVRNSGATAVVEGVGDHCCEYMTGGVVVVLGRTGRNFAAGMSGGVAFVLDEQGKFKGRCNTGMVELETVVTSEDKQLLHDLITKHFMYTGSRKAKQVLDTFDGTVPKFVKVMPVDYKRVMEERKRKASAVH